MRQPHDPGSSSPRNSRARTKPAARSAVVARVASECGVVPADVVFVKPGRCPGRLRASCAGWRSSATWREQADDGIGRRSAAEDYSELLDRVFDDRVTKWTAEAEETERFPRKLIEYLGESGVFAAKWPAGQQNSDVAKVIALARSSAYWDRQASASAWGCTTRRSRSCAASASRTTSATSPSRLSAAKLCCASAPPSSRADPTFRSSAPKSGPYGTASRSRASRSSSRCPPSPTTSWRWPATSTTTRTASTAAWSSSPFLGAVRNSAAIPQGRRRTIGHRRRAHRHLGARRRTGRACGHRPGRDLLGPGTGADVGGGPGVDVGPAGHRDHTGTHDDSRQFGHTLYEHQALRLRIADLQARVDMLR